MSKKINRRDFLYKFSKYSIYSFAGISVFKRRYLFKIKLFFINFFLGRLTPRRNENVIFAEEGDRIVFQTDNSPKYEMNETASFIWKNCTGKKSFRKIAKQISEEFDVSEADAFRDASFIIRKMEKLGYLNYV